MKAPGVYPQGADRRRALARAQEAMREYGEWVDALEDAIRIARSWRIRARTRKWVFDSLPRPSIRLLTLYEQAHDAYLAALDNIYICAESARSAEASARILYELYEQKELP